jgi:hypothetical protein
LYNFSLSSRKIKGSEDYYFSRVLLHGLYNNDSKERINFISNILNTHYHLNEDDYKIEEKTNRQNEFVIIPKSKKCRQNVSDLLISLSVNK